MKLTIDSLEYIPAKYQTKGRSRPITLIGVHSTESLEVEGGAWQIARYFQKPPRPGSSHIVVDDIETLRCVHDADTAAAAIGANANGLHIEQVGTAKQSASEWNDEYSKGVIKRAAQVIAEWCFKFKIPVKHLTDAELAAGQKGIVGHDAITRVAKAQHKPNSGHWDPGPFYPWEDLMVQVQAIYNKITGTK